MRQHLETIYAYCVGTEAQRTKVWQVLTRHYFQRRVKPTDAVLDVGAGDSKFVNDIRAARRYLLDLNLFTPLKAWAVESGSLDVVFSCNLFEQLPIKILFSRWD